MKKIFCILLSFCLLISLSVTVFAKDTVSTFISDPVCYTDEDGFYHDFYMFEGIFEGSSILSAFLFEVIYDPSFVSADVIYVDEFFFYPEFYFHNLQSIDYTSLPLQLKVYSFDYSSLSYMFSLPESFDFYTAESDSNITDVLYMLPIDCSSYQYFPYTHLNLVSNVRGTDLPYTDFVSYKEFITIPSEEETSSGLPVAPSDNINDDNDPSLPVADTTLVIDDQLPFDTVNLSSSFDSLIRFIVSLFRSVIQRLDSIVIWNTTSLLDFHIAISVFGILFAALFVVVRSSVSNSISGSDKVKRSKGD